MDINEAYSEVQGFGAACGVHNVWEALRYMEMCWDDLDRYPKQAYKLVKQELEKEMTNGN